RVSYSYPADDSITINGHTFPIADPTAGIGNDRATEVFTIEGLPCNEATGLIVSAHFTDDPTCEATTTYDAPGPCSITIDALVVSNCTVGKYQLEVTFSYENAPGKLSINGRTFMPAYSSGTQTILLTSLNCNENTNDSIIIEFVEDTNCSASQSYQVPCPVPRICLPDGG
ncbi:MAG: hypothetical protein GY746_12585, partial [Gammaproteobacteria bacterium]|nr:hypothetical protein [Gammaproteobacteria bacterium]